MWDIVIYLLSLISKVEAGLYASSVVGPPFLCRFANHNFFHYIPLNLYEISDTDNSNIFNYDLRMETRLLFQSCSWAHYQITKSGPSWPSICGYIYIYILYIERDDWLSYIFISKFELDHLRMAQMYSPQKKIKK